MGGGTEATKAVPARPATTGALMRRLVELARPEWKALAAGGFFLTLGSAASLAYPLGIRLIIDNALTTKDRALIDRAALAMGAVFLVQAIASALRHYLFITTGDRVVARLRERLYRSLITQEIAFFDVTRTGELTNRLASDTAVLQGTVSSNLSIGLRSLFTAAGGMVLLVYTSPRLTALMLACVPLVALGAVAYGRRVRMLGRGVQDSLAKASEIAEESLSGIRTVRSFAAEEAEATRYDAAVQESFVLARSRAFANATFMAGAMFAVSTSGAIVFWYGGRLVISGSLSVGGLTSFLVYTLLVAFSLGALSDLWAAFMSAAGASERVFELIDRVPAIPGGGAIPDHVEGRVAFRNVHFAYPSRRDVEVLRGIDVEIATGEMVALVGPSGAGKSTVASLLARLYDPDLGTILLDGADLKTLDPVWLRQKISAVSQEPILFSTTVAANIRYGRATASDAEVEAAARTANAHSFIAGFPSGYETLVGERGIQLSGGQKQRVAIARAVLKDPRILVLDEATSALDAESEFLVKEALERLMKGRTTLVIAHRLSTVINADRVLVLEGGMIVQSGTHSALLEQGGLYRNLVARQLAAT